ncbi:MAG: hypothetical protein HQL06_12095 [Nitrospirae bacterium]|nr:hypothetical protein [Nitrospirota bacterium]
MPLFNHYLLFHSVAEIFSIIVAYSIFVVAWNSKKWMANDYLLFLGIASLFIGVLDLVHTLAFKGMGVFINHDEVNRAASIWIAARYLESISLLIAPLFFKKKLHIKPVILIYSLIVFVVLGAIIFWGIFPTCFVDGKGLTSFKKISEYVISLILLTALFMLRKNRKEFNPKVFKLLNYAIIVTIFTELMFTFYSLPYDIFNFAGHILKIASFFLMYRAIVVTGIKRPFDIIFRQLKHNEDELRHLNRQLEIRVDQEVTVSHQKEQLLIHQSKMAAMGEMIGAIAHQWRQPLNAISVMIMDVKDAYVFGEINEDYINTITQNIDNQIQFMSNTINDFRKFLQPSKEKVPFNVSHAIKDVLLLFAFMMNKNYIEIKLECKESGVKKILFRQDCIDICQCEEGFIVYGYPNEFKHVIFNLINNARDAIITGRVRGVSSKETKGDISIVLYSINSSVRIEIADNGGGIPQEIMERVFDPYFTTKEEAQGTGIGLYISKVIIENNMSGHLSCENSDTGAIFKIDLKYMAKPVHTLDTSEKK